MGSATGKKESGGKEQNEKRVMMMSMLASCRNKKGRENNALYAETNEETLKLPLMNVGKPLKRMTRPTKMQPNQLAYGWNGAFQGL